MVTSEPTRTGKPRALVEVTDTIRVPFVTGIQRTVREVIAHWPSGAAVELVPVVHTGRRFRTLTDPERARLAGAIAPAPAPPGALRRLVAAVPGARTLRDAIRGLVVRLTDRRWDEVAVELGPDTVLLELEATWWSPAPRPELLPELRSRRVPIATLVYDLMLLDRPEWFDGANRAAFEPWARAQLANADLVLCYSRFCADEVRRFGGADAPPTVSFTPGADAASVVPVEPAVLPTTPSFALSLGTIEPRKNLGFLLDVFDELWSRGSGLGLVLVGREGWDVGGLVERIRSHPELGRRLVWLAGASDAEVDWLYRHALVVLVPSLCEGYGLPVVEARARGASVIASDGGALAEVGDDQVVHLAPDDLSGWVAAVGELEVAGASPAGGLAAERVAAPTATWTEAAAQIAAHVADLVERGPRHLA